MPAVHPLTDRASILRAPVTRFPCSTSQCAEKASCHSAGDVSRRYAGAVECDGTLENIHATALNGSIIVKNRADAAHFRGAECRTNNGRVELSFPADASFDLQSHTLMGSIASDFDVVSVGGLQGPGERLNGKVGNGGPPVVIESLNGNLALRTIPEVRR